MLVNKEKRYQLIGANYVCELAGGEIKLSEEHEGCKWVNVKELLESKEYPQWLKELVKTARLRSAF